MIFTISLRISWWRSSYQSDTLLMATFRGSLFLFKRGRLYPLQIPAVLFHFSTFQQSDSIFGTLPGLIAETHALFSFRWRPELVGLYSNLVGSGSRCLKIGRASSAWSIVATWKSSNAEAYTGISFWTLASWFCFMLHSLTRSCYGLRKHEGRWAPMFTLSTLFTPSTETHTKKSRWNYRIRFVIPRNFFLH